MIQFLHRLLWFVILLLVQVLILNHLHIDGYGTPVLFIYYIFMLNAETPRISVMLQAFCLGLCVDIFSNTPGMNASACTLLAFVRRGLLASQVDRDINEDYEPGIRIMGFWPFSRYIFIGSILYVLVWQTIDTFSFFRIGELVFKILASTATTMLCILCVDTIRRKK
ncbi:rod shape-determining protein MreD [uncultured Bacteroides sp.]|uniref:rod shape-determining protein MreD n=1 Tax=uncultured Bacteroides sp. TaxID=162156 RepID=UPI00263311B9|nr:rod shape-determining protein MreD [uncultured Bacteroides sp.]